MLAKRFLLSVCLSLAIVLVAGCGESDEHDGHGDHDNHGDVSTPGGIDSHDDHGGSHADRLGPAEIAGRQVTVTLFSDLKPGATVHGDIKVTGDPVDAVRGWVGTESGEGSLKSKAGGSGGRYHIDIEAPDNLADDAKLWIELEISGQTHAQGLELPSH